MLEGSFYRAAVIFTIAFVVYSGVINGPFLFDDPQAIERNPDVKVISN